MVKYFDIDMWNSSVLLYKMEIISKAENISVVFLIINNGSFDKSDENFYWPDWLNSQMNSFYITYYIKYVHSIVHIIFIFYYVYVRFQRVILKMPFKLWISTHWRRDKWEAI